MVKQVGLPLDFKLGVFLVAETFVIVNSHFQFVADGFKLLIQKFIGTDAIGFRPDIGHQLERLGIRLHSPPSEDVTPRETIKQRRTCFALASHSQYPNSSWKGFGAPTRQAVVA